MFSLPGLRRFLTSTLALVALIPVAATASPGDVSQASRGNDSARALRQLIQTRNLPDALGVELEILVIETRSAMGDGEALLETATRVARRLGEASPHVDRAFLDAFTGEYEALLAVAAGDGDWKYDLEPYPLRKCDANFNCVWARSIYCLRILWTGPDGSGGVNCITANPEG